MKQAGFDLWTTSNLRWHEQIRFGFAIVHTRSNYSASRCVGAQCEQEWKDPLPYVNTTRISIQWIDNCSFGATSGPPTCERLVLGVVVRFSIGIKMEVLSLFDYTFQFEISTEQESNFISLFRSIPSQDAQR